MRLVVSVLISHPSRGEQRVQVHSPAQLAKDGGQMRSSQTTTYRWVRQPSATFFAEVQAGAGLAPSPSGSATPLGRPDGGVFYVFSLSSACATI